MAKPGIAIMVAEKMKDKGESKPDDSDGGLDYSRMAKDLVSGVKEGDTKLVEAILKALAG